MSICNNIKVLWLQQTFALNMLISVTDHSGIINMYNRNQVFTCVTIFWKPYIKLLTYIEEMLKPQWKIDNKFHISLLPTAIKYKKNLDVFMVLTLLCTCVFLCPHGQQAHIHMHMQIYNCVHLCIRIYSVIFSETVMLQYPQRINIWKQTSDQSNWIGNVPHFCIPVEGPHFLFSSYYIQELRINIHQPECQIQTELGIFTADITE
jgi:hypothetical protein